MALSSVNALPAWRVILLVIAVATSIGCSANEQQGERLDVWIAGREFHLELALDGQTRQQGLSDRKSIAPDGGMLFVMPRPTIQNFVMRRCLVPIDVIYLDPNGRIVSMHQMQVEPYQTPEQELVRYSSSYLAQFAIELKGGTLGQLKLTKGDKIDLPMADLKARSR